MREVLWHFRQAADDAVGQAGAVTGDELAAIKAWTNAWDVAERAGPTRRTTEHRHAVTPASGCHVVRRIGARRIVGHGQTQRPLQLKSRSHTCPAHAVEVVHAVCVENQWEKSHVHCCRQMAFWLLSSVRLDGVDTSACVLDEGAGAVVVGSGPRLQPMRPENRVTARTRDFMREAPDQWVVVKRRRA